MGQHFKLTSFLIVLGIMPLSAAEDNDNAKIQGTWKVTSREHAGKKFPGENLGEFVFSGDSFTMRGKRTLKGKYKLDSSKSPKHLDLNFTGENGDVVPSPAIYKLEGHRLTICRSRCRTTTPHRVQARPGVGGIARRIGQGEREASRNKKPRPFRWRLDFRSHQQSFDLESEGNKTPYIQPRRDGVGWVVSPAHRSQPRCR